MLNKLAHSLICAEKVSITAKAPLASILRDCDPFQNSLPCWSDVPLVQFGKIDRRLTILPRMSWEAAGYHKATIHAKHTGW